MPTYQEIRAQIAALGWADTFGTRREVKLLPQILTADEHILGVTTGVMAAPGKSAVTTWLLVLSQHRILLLDKKLVVGFEQHEIPVSRISSVSHRTGIMFGEITLRTSETTLTVKNVLKATTRPFSDALTRAIRGELSAPQPVAVGHGLGPPPVPVAAPAAPQQLGEIAAFYVMFGGAQSGPHGMDAMVSAARMGQLGPQTLVWWPGAAGWVEAATVPQLACLFRPPPPPP